MQAAAENGNPKTIQLLFSRARQRLIVPFVVAGSHGFRDGEGGASGRDRRKNGTARPGLVLLNSPIIRGSSLLLEPARFTTHQVAEVLY